MKRTVSIQVLKTTIVASIVCSTQLSWGQQMLTIKNRNVALSPYVAPGTVPVRSGIQADPQLVYLKFGSPPDEAGLKKVGIALQDHIGESTFTAIIPKSIDQLSKIDGLSAWARVLPEDKVSTYFSSQPADVRTKILVSLSKGADSTVLSDLGFNLSATEQLWKEQNKWIVSASPDQLTRIAAQNKVLYISPKFEDKPLNAEGISRANAAYARSVQGYGLTGEGIVVGVGDDSYTDHIDIIDRVNNLNPGLNSSHGHHVAGTVAGAGIINETYAGFAPKARVVTNYFSNIIAFAPQYESNFNMKLTNNSYAAIVQNCDYAGTYDASSQYLDQQAIDRPELLNIFAAGNDGWMTCPPFPAGYATVVGSYQVAKNPLVVGQTTKHQDLTNASTGRGPVKDGRLKPEIMAVGTNIISNAMNNAYEQISGTSMACPNVSGAAALLQQRFKAQNGGQYPKSALLKAIMMNTATDMGNPGPDYGHGFGLLNVGEAVKAIDQTRYLSGTIGHSGQMTHNITVPANMGQLKIMLYWNDAPASPANAKALVNDLDLVVNTPGNGVLLPLILNPDPAFVLNNASPGVDHLNNAEQVTVNDPQAGTYQVNVSGFNIPTGTQEYYITYTFVEKGISIKYPSAGSKVVVDSPTIIHWDAIGNTGPFSVEYSLNNGSSWTTVSTTTAEKRYAIFTPPSGIASDQCLVRVSRPGETATSAPFNIMGRPLVSLAASQCPGNIQIQWTAVPGSSRYFVYRKIGTDMLVVDSTNGTSYTFSGLSTDSTYWVAVAASAGQSKGIRSIAVRRKPDNGNCNSIAHHGDLAITKLLQPISGRSHTSTALGSNTVISLQVRNNDNVNNTGFQVDYRVNNGSWQTYTPPVATIPAAGQATVNIPGLDLSAIGNYDIIAVIRNTVVTDPVAANDTIRFTLKQLANEPMNLGVPHTENFENTPAISSNLPIIGLPNAERFDFQNSTATGRLRSFILDEILIGGNRSISLDNSMNQKNDLGGSSFNTLTATYNLSDLNITTDEVRFEFDYRLHGVPAFDTANKVFIRGSDAHPWIALPVFDSYNIGVVNKYGAFSLRDHLASNGHPFSTSTQIRIMQRDMTMIGGAAYGRGLTVDNMTLFKAEKDVALIDARNIQKFNCGLNSAVPLTVRIANTMPNDLSNIPIFYQVDAQSIVSETVPLINAKDTIDYTFTQNLDLSALGGHNITVWTAFPGDNYTANDTLKDIKIHHQPLVNSFPYLEGFEDNNGYYFEDGQNSSWEYGTPDAINIDRAANGTKAWKTKIAGAYNANERSYLFSPCFDLSTLSAPMLSFSFFREIENPGDVVFDSAFVEYSTDGGANWQKLGHKGEGYNWYNHEADSWVGTDHNYWSVSSIALPQSSSLSLRWVLHTDVGAEFAGLGIDDVHIFDHQRSIFDADSFASAPVAVVNALTEFSDGNDISGVIDPLGQSLGSVTFQSYKHTDFISPDSQQLYLPRSFALKAPVSSAANNFRLSLFVKDSLMSVVRNTSICNACTSHPKEVYQLGVTTYVENGNANINGDLADNLGGDFGYISKEDIRWVPYFDGYYAVFETAQIGEYWFNDGGITGSNPLPHFTLEFDAVKTGARVARIYWKNAIDEHVLSYQLQADEGEGFKPVWNIDAVGDKEHEYIFTDTPDLALAPHTFYRLRYTNRDGRNLVSPIRKITWEGLPVSFDVFPNPTHDGTINFRWYNNGEESFEWAIFALSGQKLSSGKVEQDRFSGTETIKLKDFAQIGNLFILKVRFKNTTKEFKIVYQPDH